MFTLMFVVFVLGYIAIALEHPLKINKAATALILGALMWTLYMWGADSILAGPGADGDRSSLARERLDLSLGRN